MMKSMKVSEMVNQSKDMYDLTKATYALVLLKGIMFNPYNEFMTGDIASAIREVDNIKDRLQRKLDTYLENRKRTYDNDSSEASAKVDNQEDMNRTSSSGSADKVDQDTENPHTQRILDNAVNGEVAPLRTGTKG